MPYAVVRHLRNIDRGPAAFSRLARDGDNYTLEDVLHNLLWV